MKIQKNKIYTLLITSIVILFSVFLFNKINIKYHPNGIIGQYSINNYNSLNDPLKYLIIIFLPSVAFLLSKIFIEKKNWRVFFNFFKIEQKTNLNKDNSYILFFFIFFVLLIIEFFSLNFSYHKLDIFHSGQKLNSAYKSLIDNTLWSGSYITSGIFLEILHAKSIWKLFNYQSIGLVRFSETILILISKFLLLLLALNISKIIDIEKNLRSIFFVILSFILIGFVDYDINSADLIESREILNLILIILSLNYIISDNKKFKISFILLGSLSAISFLWSIDRAIIYNLVLIFILIYFALNKNFKSLINVTVIIISTWIIIYLILGNEFKYFISNLISIFKEINDVHGVIHPQLFSDDPNASRATKTIFTILFTILFSLNLIFKNETESNDHPFKVFLTLLAVFGFLSYIYALGRSDGGHIRQAFGYPLIFVIILILSKIFFSLNKININLKFKYFNIILSIIIIFISTLIMSFNFLNIKNYKDNFFNYIYAEDKEFLEKDDYDFILQSSKLLENENCIDLYTYDSPLLYLLRKPSCSKYSFLWSLGSEKNQKEFINSLNNSNVVITNGKTDHWGQITFNIKYPVLDEYIKNNFKDEINIGKRKIKFKN